MKKKNFLHLRWSLKVIPFDGAENIRQNGYPDGLKITLTHTERIQWVPVLVISSINLRARSLKLQDYKSQEKRWRGEVTREYSLAGHIARAVRSYPGR